MRFVPLTNQESDNLAEMIIIALDIETKLVVKLHVNHYEIDKLSKWEVYEVKNVFAKGEFQEYDLRNCEIVKSSERVELKKYLDMLSSSPDAIEEKYNHGNICKITDVYSLEYEGSKMKMVASIAGYLNKKFVLVITDAKWTNFWRNNVSEKDKEMVLEYLVSDKNHSLYAVIDFGKCWVVNEINCAGLVLV